MPRALYHLEGQQLRLMAENLNRALRRLDPPRTSIVDAAVEIVSVRTMIEQILADGPHSRDEKD